MFGKKYMFTITLCMQGEFVFCFNKTTLNLIMFKFYHTFKLNIFKENLQHKSFAPKQRTTISSYTYSNYLKLKRNKDNIGAFQIPTKNMQQLFSISETKHH